MEVTKEEYEKYHRIIGLFEDWTQHMAVHGPGAMDVKKVRPNAWIVSADPEGSEAPVNVTIRYTREKMFAVLEAIYREGRQHEYDRAYPDVGIPLIESFKDTEVYKMIDKLYQKEEEDDNMSKLRGDNEGPTGRKRIKMVLSRL
jgi:hypothetical protein